MCCKLGNTCTLKLMLVKGVNAFLIVGEELTPGLTMWRVRVLTRGLQTCPVLQAGGLRLTHRDHGLQTGLAEAVVTIVLWIISTALPAITVTNPAVQNIRENNAMGCNSNLWVYILA